MFQSQTNIEDGARPLLVVAATAGTSYKPLGFRQLILSLRFVICLKKTRARPPSVTRTASSRSYTAVEIHSEDEREVEKHGLKRIVRDKDLEALEKFGGVEGAVSFLRSESEPQPQGTENDGLELELISVREPLFWDSFFLSSKGFWYSSWQSLNSYTIFLLIIAAALSFAIGTLQQGLEHGWQDCAGILLAVFLLVFFPSVLSFYRKRADEKELLKNGSKLEVTVERDGICQMVSVSDVKEGEIIHLKKGDRIPADGLLIKGKNLILDEVINSNIDPVRNPFLFSCSVVKYGDGVMIAVSTGADTALGKGMLDAAVHPYSQETLLQSRINKPYEFIEKFALVVSLAILLVTLTRFVCGKRDDYFNDKPETKGEVTMGLMENVFKRMFLKSGWGASFLATVLVTMVIGIQHGMPFAITVSLSLWREKIRSFGGRSNNLSAFVTSSLVSAICIDITGKLSFHEVEVEELLIGEEMINPRMEFHPDILEGFEQAATVLGFDDSMDSVHLGKNLLSSWENSGMGMNNLESLRQKFEIIDHKVLSSRKGIGALMRRTEDIEANRNLHLHYNGDASTILNMCSQYYDIRGSIHDIENQRDCLEKVISDMTTKGLRPIAFACKQTDDLLFEEGGLKLLGFVGLKYSCQKLKTTLMDLENIGVRIILTSEDELSVAIAMADGLGIQCGTNNKMVEGERFREIMKIAGMEKNELMKSITVMAKATSEDKLLLLKELKTIGHVVAFLGGFTTSDAPTLMEADVGITQENRSNEVSRAASDLIVAAPTSLNKIIRCGRCTFLNIQKFYQVQLTASISGLLITLACTMVSGKSPLTTIHLIWVTLIMCLLGSLMMVMEELNDGGDDDEEVKIALGGDRNQPLITKHILKKIVIHVLSQALLFLVVEYLGQKLLPKMKEDVKHTMIFNTFILWQICNLFGAMGLVTKGAVVFKAVLKSRLFVIFLVGALAVQVLMIEFAGKIVNGVKLSAVQLVICFFFASLRLTMEWVWIIFLPLLATFFGECGYVDFNITLVFFASLMFVTSVVFGFHLFL